MKKSEEIVRNWFSKDLLKGKDIDILSSENQSNVRNMLAGFLQACEKFDHLSAGEAEKLFMELAK